MNLRTKIETLNEKPRIKKFANFLLACVYLQLFGVILMYKQTEYNLVSPLLPQWVTCEIYGQYVNGGILAAVGFLVMLMLKFYRQHVWVLVIGILTLIGYEVYAIMNL